MEAKNNLIESLNWRYATKKFDSNKKVSDLDFNEILESLRLSPSSFGLQPWKFIVVKDKSLREKIKASAWGQTQVTEASHLIILCARTDVTEKYIENYIEQIAKQRNLPKEGLNGFSDMMKGFRKGHSSNSIVEWAKKQTYIALGTMLTTAAVKKIDACPMEGFNPGEVDKILGLESQGLTSAVICPVGYRASDDSSANYKKVRYSQKEVVEFR